MRVPRTGRSFWPPGGSPCGGSPLRVLRHRARRSSTSSAVTTVAFRPVGSRHVVGIYPAQPDTTLWVAYPSAGAAERVTVEAWAVCRDGKVIPIAAYGMDDASVLTGRLWDEDFDELALRWLFELAPLPLLPPGSSVGPVPVSWFTDDVLVVGRVGPGNATWGPFRVDADLVTAGIDTVASAERPHLRNGLVMLNPGPHTTCRITCDRAVTESDEVLATILLELHPA